MTPDKKYIILVKDKDGNMVPYGNGEPRLMSDNFMQLYDAIECEKKLKEVQE